MYTIVGLGNPGKEYEQTRHNTGFLILEGVRKSWEFPEWKEEKKLRALVSTENHDGQKVTLLFPQTFMNKSGLSLKPIITNLKKAEKLAIIHDDLDLPLGTIKIAFDRGSAGHRGVESIMRTIKTKAFLRLRVGVSGTNAKGEVKKPKGEKAVNDFILKNFSSKEDHEFNKLIRRADEILTTWVTEGRGKATETANRK